MIQVHDPNPDKMIRVRAGTHKRLLQMAEAFRAYCAANPDKYPLSMSRNISISDTIEMMLMLIPEEWKRV